MRATTCIERIYVWPDGAWCAPDELEAMLSWRSDDVAVIRCEGTDEANDRNAAAAAAGTLASSMYIRC